MPKISPVVQVPVIHARDYPGLQHIGLAAERVIAALAATLKKG